MNITNKDIGWGIIFGVGVGHLGGAWAMPIALAILALCAYLDWLIETGRVKQRDDIERGP